MQDTIDTSSYIMTQGAFDALGKYIETAQQKVEEIGADQPENVFESATGARGMCISGNDQSHLEALQGAKEARDNAIIVDPNAVKKPKKVGICTIAQVKHLPESSFEGTEDYAILGYWDLQFRNGTGYTGTTPKSPLGSLLMGKQVGDKVTFPVKHDRTMVMEITSIKSYFDYQQ